MKKKKKTGRKSGWKWLIVLAVLAAGAAGGKWAMDHGYLENIPGLKTAKEPVVLNTATVERGTILRTTEGNGAIEAADTRTAEAPFDLKISEVKVENGDLLKEGDLIFFPGHVAVYIAGGRYVHATAYRKTPRVTLGSLNLDDRDYRQDLAESITAFGSLFSS